MPSPFSYPERPYDRALAAAGQLERLARAAARSLRSLQIPKVPRTSRPVAAVPETPAAWKAPILYLPAVSWAYRFQRPQHLALALARAGHPVLYVDGFLRSRLLPARHLLHSQGGVHILRMRVPGRPDPYREPLNQRAAISMADTILAGLKGERPLMVFVQLPFWAELGRELARRLGVPLVYDRIDLHTGFPGVPGSIEEAEDRLIREADLVCATATLLAKKPRELNPRVILLPNGVDLTAFPRLASPGGSGIRIGYVGALGPWFDAEAVEHAARAEPDWHFRLAGRVEAPEVAALSALPNLETVGEIPFAEVHGFLSGLDIALIPFRDLPLTRAVDPVKLYEALATGLPVVARRLPETGRWAEPLVYLYDDPESFVRQLRRAVEENTPALALERRRAAEGASWDRRAAELEDLLTVREVSPEMALELDRLIREELEYFDSDEQREAFLSFRIEPVQATQKWQYGDELHPCFIVAKGEKVQIVYCPSGFGQSFPWSVQRHGEIDLGMDSDWYAYLYEAFICSGLWAEEPDDFMLRGPGERAKA